MSNPIPVFEATATQVNKGITNDLLRTMSPDGTRRHGQDCAEVCERTVAFRPARAENAMTAAMQTGKEAESAPPSVLVVAVRHWPFVTRLYMEMADRGVIVRAIVPSHHALHRMQKDSTDLLGRTRWRALPTLAAQLPSTPRAW
jgi:hypothetical protein